jgi:hypothetical protein
MSDIDHVIGTARSAKKTQWGTTSIEFALLAVVFFVFVFGILEVARAMYLINTLQEVTRRAAATAVNVGFGTAALDQIRSSAMFADNSGNLLLGAPITPAHLKIEYLSASRDSTSGAMQLHVVSNMPSCAARNRLNCLANPYADNCVRFVKVRVCQPDGASTCTPVPYQSLFPIAGFSTLKLPRSTTIAAVQGLGYQVGDVPCP